MLGLMELLRQNPASLGLERFLAVNTLLGYLTTAFAGSYHSFNFAKCAHRYFARVSSAPLQAPLELGCNPWSFAPSFCHHQAELQASHSCN